ncbi:hypothetical protein Tco_1577077 [Tanacetum coccineum]
MLAGFDKSKVECFNCHKLGHFARECRAPRSQDRSRRESYKKEPKVEEPSHKAMMAIDGIGWDWSFMAEENEASENQALVAEEVVPTEFALMAMSSSSSDNEVYDDSYCSKSCRKNTENLTTKISKLREELFDSESDLCNYKRGLSQVEARLVEFKINESKFCEKIRVLERDLELKDYKIKNLTNELEEVKKERDGIDSKLEKFVNSSKDLDQMLESQKSGLPEFADNTVTDYTRPTPSIDVTNDVRNELDGNNLNVYEHGGTSSNAVSKPIVNFVKESSCPNVIKINNIENARKTTAKYAELYRNFTQSSNVRSNNFGPPIIEDWDSEDESDTEATPIESIRSTINQNRDQPRGNQRNWNNLKSQHLGKDFVMQNKACYKCGSFEHLKVPTARTKNTTVGLKVPTAKPTVAAVKGNKGKAIKASARWIWKPKQISGEDYEPYDGGYVSFGYGGGNISGKGTIKTDFKLEDDRHASVNESMLWHRRLGHLNFKTMNKLVRNNLVIGLPSKIFENDHSCVDCLKGKQHKASCKSKLANSTSKPLHTLHMDLFGPTSISSLNHKWYCLVVTDDFSRFSWTFFLKTKDETYRILRNFITEIENLKDLKVKIIRCDNGGEFRNKEMDDFCSRKGIKREFSNARTPQQNGVAERRNRTLIEAARTMLADAKLPVTFWAEAVNTACYVQNRVLVTKPLNKTPYELFNGRAPAIGFLRPFGCHVMILNTLDHLGKFDAKGDEGFFVGYSLNSKAFRVYNKRTKHIEENLHINFLESKVIDKAGGPNWLFDIESLTKSMNYIPVVGAGTSSSNISGTKEDVKQAEKGSPLRFIALPNWFHEAQMITTNDAAKKRGGILIDSPQKEQEEVHTNKYIPEQVEHEVHEEVPESSGIMFPTASSKESSNLPSNPTVETAIPTVSTHVPTDSENIFTIDPSEPPSTPTVESTVPTNRVEDFFGDSTHATRLNEVEADLSNMETTFQVSPTPTLRIHKDHPKNQIIGPVDTLIFTRHKSKNVDEQSLLAIIHQKIDPDLLQLCLFSAFLSQEEPKKIFEALKDSSWVEAMQEELLQFQIQNVWVLVDCPKGAKLVAQGHTQEEGIDYEEVFTPVTRIEAIRLFLAYASYMGFTVYQMDVKSAFLYGTIDEEVYVMQPPIFQDPQFPHKVYKMVKAMYGLHQAPRAWYGTLSKYLLDNGFQRGTIDQTLFIKKHKGEFLLVQVYVDNIIFGSSNPKLCREFEALMHDKFKMSAMGELSFFLGLQVLQKKDGIFLSQDKYVGDILKKFGFSDLRSANTPMDREHPWGKDGTGKDVDLHLYRSMIGSLMYLTASRPDIMFAVCDSAKHHSDIQRMPYSCTLKRIFRYLKDILRSPPYRGCQFLGRRLISWQCKKQTIVATSTTEAEYVAAASGCGQVLWIKNQLLDYGYNFMNTKIYIDNNSAIYDNVADVLTKAFDVGIFQYLVVAIFGEHRAYIDFNQDSWTSFKLLKSADGKTNILLKSKGSKGTFSESSIGGIQTKIIEEERVTSLGGDEGSLKQKLKELMEFCTTLQSQQTQMGEKIQSQDLEIKQLKAMIQTLEDAQKPREGVQEDAPNRGGIDQGEVNVFKGDAEKDSSKTSGGLKEVFTTASPQVPPVSSNVSTAIVTTSEKDPTAEVLTTARDTTPYTRRPRASRGVVIRSTSLIPISIPSAGTEDRWMERELQEEFVHEDQSIREQIKRGAEIARIQAEEDLRQMINELDRSNVMINKHMAEYEEVENGQAKGGLRRYSELGQAQRFMFEPVALILLWQFEVLLRLEVVQFIGKVLLLVMVG